MAQISDVINRLKQKIGIVVADNKQLSDKLVKSNQKNIELTKECERLRKEISALNERVKVLEISGGLVNVSGGTKSAGERVNKLLKEIDKCIALMNR